MNATEPMADFSLSKKFLLHLAVSIFQASLDAREQHDAMGCGRNRIQLAISSGG
jgi:hypothetical protein